MSKQGTDNFIQTVEEALKKFNDPLWLGTHSPLAAPYLLNLFVRPTANVDLTNQVARGKALQQLLQTVARSLTAENEIEQRECKILELRYLSARPKRVSGHKGLLDLLSITANTYNLSKNAAIERLAQALITYLQPALRLDAVTLPPQLLARDTELNLCWQVLQQKKSLSLIGEGGIGKTALASTLAHRFAANSSFWLTIRPGLNDRLNSVFFALAHFLHSQDAPDLLAQLVADGGEIKNQQLIFDLLQKGLEQLAHKPCVLCFDEVDLLKPEEIQNHKEIVTLLESLAVLVPTIFIGQRHIVQIEEVFPLSGFSLANIQEFLLHSQISLTADELEFVHTSTNGNPRLLELFIALHQSLARNNLPLQDIFTNLAHHSSIDSLLRRIRQHLTRTELYILQQLSVFRRAAPLEIWTMLDEQTALAQLISWRLVQPDQTGGVKLLPTYQSAMYEQLTVNEKEVFHQQAASIRSQRGQFTSAAYHYWAGGESEIAISLWNQYHESEINQGQATAALALLQSVSERQLSRSAGEILRWRRAELHKLLGNYDEALQDLQQNDWNTPVQTSQAQRMRGDIAELRGQARKALVAYQTAQNALEQGIIEAAHLHRAWGYLALHERDYVHAQREVSRIRHDAANLEGFLHERSGNLQAAQAAYQEAIQLAEQAHYPYGKANAHMNLGCIYVWKRDLPQAKEHLLSAIDYFERCHIVNKLGEAISNLALAYLQAKEYNASITQAQRSRIIFEQIRLKRGVAAAHQLLAEAYYAQGDWKTAEAHVQQALVSGDPTIQPDSLRLFGEIKLRQGHLQEAEALVLKALELVRDKPDKILEGYIWRALGAVYLAQKNHTQGQQTLQKAKQIFMEAGLSQEIEETETLGI